MISRFYLLSFAFILDPEPKPAILLRDLYMELYTPEGEGEPPYIVGIRSFDYFADSPVEIFKFIC